MWAACPWSLIQTSRMYVLEKLISTCDLFENHTGLGFQMISHP